MEYRQFPGTDLKLSAITFGTIEFAARPKGWHRDTEEGQRALHLALDNGVNCIHSSYEYETWYAVRQVLAQRRDAQQVKHIVKIPDPDFDRTDLKFVPAYFRKMVEDSLAGLKAERIDLVQWALRDNNECDPKLAIAGFRACRDELLALFGKLRDEGKVGHLACFVYTNEFAEEVLASGAVSALLFYYNLWDTTLQPTVAKLARHNTGAVAYRPFQGGLLVSKRADRNALPEGDRFRSPGAQKRLEARDRLFAAAGLKPDDLTRQAVAFCLATPSIITLVTGMNSREQVKQVLAAAESQRPDPDLGRRLFDAAGQLGLRRQCNR